MIKKWSKKQAEQLETLEKKQMEARQEILRLEEEMERLVQKGVDADALDQRILSIDYEALRMETETAKEHFYALGNIIAQMRAERVKSHEAQMLKQMESYQDCIDYAEMVRNSDYITVCREVEREEQACFNALSSEQAFGVTDALANIEFIRRIANARENRAAEKNI